MKYGLMYYKSTDNIGDDIQTYVAIKYLPHIDYYIDRESLSCFIPEEKEYISMIMNGWYIHNKIAWPPSPYIHPLLISMHFKDLEETDVGDSYLKTFGGEFLNKYGPVGARDLETQKRLQKNGIDAYFSGCMTLTLEKFDNVKKKNKISIVDVEKNVIEKVENNTDYDIEILSHFLNPKEIERKSIDERMNDVENLLKKYQESFLVITSRLHSALPCVALGTPVILLHKENYDIDRFGVFLDYFDSYFEKDFLNMEVREILKNPKPNSTKYSKIRDSINKICKDFIDKCENIDYIEKLKSGDLPNIKEYEEYVKKLEWYKWIYEKERLALENLEKKRVKEFEFYHKEIKNVNIEKEKILQSQMAIEDELLKCKKEKLELAQDLSKIYNSKGWKYLESFRSMINSINGSWR